MRACSCSPRTFSSSPMRSRRCDEPSDKTTNSTAPGSGDGGQVLDPGPGCRRSPEAELAHAAVPLGSGTGRELVEREYVRDVERAAEFDVSDCAPELVGGAYGSSAGG